MVSRCEWDVAGYCGLWWAVSGEWLSTLDETVAIGAVSDDVGEIWSI